MLSRADNEPNQLDNSLKLDTTINSLNFLQNKNSLNLVHEPNELNLSLLNKGAELELYIIRLGWFMS